MQTGLSRKVRAYTKILHGTAPGDLPVEFPSKLLLAINIKDGQGSRHHCGIVSARSRRRGDRMTMFFCCNALSPEMALRVISRQCSTSVAFGAKRTLSQNRLRIRLYEAGGQSQSASEATKPSQSFSRLAGFEVA
jgi:hypothetical protein